VASFVVVIVLVWTAAGALKRSGRLRAGDARKLNHVCALAGGALWFGWLAPDVARASFFVAGAMLFALLLLACGLRRLPPFAVVFHGYARETDAPHEGRHVWISWLVTMYGLGLVDVLFADMAVTRTAALLLGVADGIAEPVGSRFGRHRYVVPDLLFGARHTRSLEGSLAVFGASLAVLLCIGAGTGIMGGAGDLLVALGVTLCEAVSPHGLDNFTIPLTSGTLLCLLT
jgi:phytol kinase